MNKDLIFKEGDIVTHKINNVTTKLYISGLSNWTIKQFESDGLGKVLKVERPTKYETIYEVKEILDEKEKEYLSYVIRPFRDRVGGIKKIITWYKDDEFLKIIMKNEDDIYFPYFEKNTMYKGMEIDKEYTLEELGL